MGMLAVTNTAAKIVFSTYQCSHSPHITWQSLPRTKQGHLNLPLKAGFIPHPLSASRWNLLWKPTGRKSTLEMLSGCLPTFPALYHIWLAWVFFSLMDKGKNWIIMSHFVGNSPSRAGSGVSPLLSFPLRAQKGWQQVVPCLVDARGVSRRNQPGCSHTDLIDHFLCSPCWVPVAYTLHSVHKLLVFH